MEQIKLDKRINVAYYRVSTKRQGLGLDAQKHMVFGFLKENPDFEFLEKESGTSTDKRTQLKAAIELCRKVDGRLIIANLSRLSRNVHFLSGLLESKLDFVCCDNPSCSPLLIHILAAVAQEEAKNISRNTILALEAKRMRELEKGNVNFRFGPKVSAWNKNYVPDEPWKLTREQLIANKKKPFFEEWIQDSFNQSIFLKIRELIECGMDCNRVLSYFNENGVKDRFGHDFWTRLAVSRLYAKVIENPEWCQSVENENYEQTESRFFQ